MRGRLRGFTILELMFAIAILAVLVGVAAPSFFGDARKARARSEVGSVFSDIRARLEQYKLENSNYPPTGTEANTWPTATPDATKRTVFPLPAPWVDIKMVLSNETDLYCGYSWITGRGRLLASDGDVGNVGAIAAAAPFSFVPPQTDWYYVFAHCNIDDDTSVDSYYVSDSVNATVRALNEGH